MAHKQRQLPFVALRVAVLLAVGAGLTACGQLQPSAAGTPAAPAASPTAMTVAAADASAIAAAAPYIAGLGGTQLRAWNITDVQFVRTTLGAGDSLTHLLYPGAFISEAPAWLFVAHGNFQDEGMFIHPLPPRHTLVVLVSPAITPGAAAHIFDQPPELAQLGSVSTVPFGQSPTIDKARQLVPGQALPTPTFPTIEVGAPSLLGGKVEVPVELSGGGIAPYSGFNIHLWWSGERFSFDHASSSGSVIPSPICAPPTSDGFSGVIFACSALGGASVSAGGLLATFVLTPASPPGCSNVALFTLGPPDGGDTSTGTYTIDAATGAPQSIATANRFIDGSAQPC